MEAKDRHDSKRAAAEGQSRSLLRRVLWPFGNQPQDDEPASAQDAFVRDLELELELLREENARLKIERERLPSPGSVIDQARTLHAYTSSADDEGHDLVTEGMVLREGLLDAVREMASAMVEIERRLLDLDPDERRVVDVALARLGDPGAHQHARARRIVAATGDDEEARDGQAAVGA